MSIGTSAKRIYIPFHFPSRVVSKHFCQNSSTQQSAITSKIKIKYVMQIPKLAAFLAGVSVFVMIIKTERKVLFRFTKVKSEEKHSD